MIYAPIVITTLNRYEHLKRCVEALENCIDVEFTEIFISVDYPPDVKELKEKSWCYPTNDMNEMEEGHQNIVSYLKEKSWKFKKVNLYFQDINLGASDNSIFIKKTAFEKFDRLILLEDDIEVSKNFLLYMNQALEYGHQDKKCYCVCGWVKKTVNQTDDITAYKGVHCTPWGVGIYREKYRQMQNTVSFPWLDSIILSTPQMYKIYRKKHHLFYHLFVYYFINNSPAFRKKNGEISKCDVLQSTYMIVNDMYAIYPVKTKTKNNGFDGTGITRWQSKDEARTLDGATDFELRMPKDKKTNEKINLEITKNQKKDFKTWLYYLSHRVQAAYFLKKKFPALYNMLLWIYKKVRRLD